MLKSTLPIILFLFIAMPCCGLAETTTTEGDEERARNDSAGKQSHTMACEDYVLQFSDDINKATQEGDDEKALQLAAFVFNYFSEQGVLNKVRYGNLDADDAIVFSAHIPSSFPIKIEKNSDKETISYTVDLTSVKNIISQNGIYEYIVIISPWTGNTLFKIKISEDLLFLWTRE